MKHKIKPFRKVLTAIAVITLMTGLSTGLSGCTKPTEELPPAATSTPEPIETPTPEPINPESGGTLKLGMRHPLTLNPLTNEDGSVDKIMKLMFEPLLDIDERLKPVTGLASLAMSADGLSASLHLRDGLFWSDGVPITADDIIYSLNMLKDPDNASVYAQNVRNIDTYTKVETNQVDITFKTVFGGVGYTFNFPLIPKHADDMDNNPVCSGLFTFESYDINKEMILVQNENRMPFRKQPYIERIAVQIVKDQESEIYAFEQRVIDAISAPISDWSRFKNVGATSISEYTVNYFDFIGFNFHNPYLKDRTLREAIAYAVNIDEFVSTYYLDQAERAYTPVRPGSWLYEPEVDKYAYDPEKAKTLITRTDLEFRVLVNNENRERVKIAGALCEALDSVGIKTKLETLAFDDYLKRLNSKDYDIFIGGFNLSTIPDLSFVYGRSNFFSYQDEVMEALLHQAFTAQNDTLYKKAMSDIQLRAAKELPCIGLVFRKSVLLTDISVMGDKHPRTTNPYYNINDWFIHK